MGIGGGHYAPRFTEVSLTKRISFGHMLPVHAFDLKDLDDLARKDDTRDGAERGRARLPAQEIHEEVRGHRGGEARQPTSATGWWTARTWTISTLRSDDRLLRSLIPQSSRSFIARGRCRSPSPPRATFLPVPLLLLHLREDLAQPTSWPPTRSGTPPTTTAMCMASTISSLVAP